MNTRRGALTLLAGLLCLMAWRLETPWRRMQAAYFDRVVESSRSELALRRSERAADLRFLQGGVEVARDRLAARAGEVAEAERRLLAMERKLRAAESRREEEAYRERVDLQRRQVDDLYSGVRAAESDLSNARAPIERLEARVESLDGLHGWLRRVPVLRAVGAGVGLRQLLATVESAESVGSAARLERCTTCHLALAPDIGAPEIGAADVTAPDEKWDRLWAPHPSPDLHLRANSPHPLAEFGCTSCHGGDGLATGFVAAGHRPPDDETAARWRRDWRWRSATPSQAPKPILARTEVQSSCVRCHDAPWLRGAPTQEAGRRLARSMACAACHETGRPDLEPSVPSLVDLPLRKRAEWVAAFLADPSAWKATFMPHFWTAAEPAERDAEIAAVIAWLWRGVEVPDEPVADPPAMDEGLDVFRDLACGACHVIDKAVERSQFLGSDRLRGPSLASIGSEVRPGVLEGLLERHEPAYRWQAGEVPALAAFLDAQRSRLETVLPDVDTESRDRLLRRRLLEVTTYEDADARMDGLDGGRRDLLLGELAVRRYRCASCHRLPGAPAVDGGILGRQPMQRASSLEHIGRVSAGWPHADATLPDWRLSARETEALTVQLAGWRGAATGGRMPGRDVIARAGCTACHDLDGRGPVDFFARQPGGHGAPPSLERSGEKLRAEWIFRHLDNPSDTALRPWTGLRMPRFPLSARERSDIAEFFAARGGVAVLSSDPDLLSPAERALGAAVYDVLLCGGCHDSDTESAERHLRAPSYAGSGTRLRADWIRNWLLDPHAWDDDPSMPPPFPHRDGKPDATYLLATLDAPMFELQRRRLERFFAGRDELGAAFEDAERVADALAAYVLTLDG